MFRYLTDLVIAVDVVAFIVELELTGNLLIERAHHGVEEFVGRGVASDLLTVVESDLLVTGSVDGDRAHAE